MSSPVHWDIVCGTGEAFWDFQLTWNSSVPIFTECFQKSVLMWVPCAALWLLLPLEIYNFRHSRFKDIPWTSLRIAKLLFCVLPFLLDLARILFTTSSHATSSIPSLDVITSAIKMVTLVMTFYLTWKGRKRGITSSVTMLCFWFLFLVSEVAIFYSVMRSIVSDKLISAQHDVAIILLEIIYFPLVMTQFCLSLISDASPSRCITKGDEVRLNTEENSSVVSQMLYIWYDRLALLGYRQPLEVNDLGILKYDNSCAGVLGKFDLTVEKKTNSKTNKLGQAVVYSHGESETFLPVVFKDESKKIPFLFKSIAQVFRTQFASVLFLKLASDVVTYTIPIILSLLILFVSNQEPVWHGYVYATLFAVIKIVESLFAAHFTQRAAELSLKIRTSLMSYVYRKTLRLSNNAKAGTTVGEIVNLMSVDIAKIMMCVDMFAFMVSTPLQVVIGLVELYHFLGPSAFASIGIICVFQLITIATSTLNKRAQVGFMKLKDMRMKIMNEVLNGIKVLKLFAWEEPYEEHIEHYRKKEMMQLMKIGGLQTVNTVLWASSAHTISLTVFAAFVMTDDRNVLDASIAFTAITIFNLFRRPLIMLPNMISSLVEGIVSMERLNKFSFCDEIKPEDAQTIHSKSLAVQITDGCFSWTTGLRPCITDINLAIPKGSLVAVVGSVGSGKSSLLSAMLGEMNRLKGTVAIEDNIAYGAQLPWIQNATLKNNVLFGNVMEDTRYRKVLKACALLPDLEVLPGGDMTELGEKGINLSGGQKQRVSLARAVYYDASTYLLDDPLSAVDVYVGKHIFDNVIGPNGLLKNKTRVLVTHGLTYLPEMDCIIVLTDGTISEVGTYKDLMSEQGAFADFIDNYANNTNSDCEKGGVDIAEAIVENLPRKSKIERTISTKSNGSQSGKGQKEVTEVKGAAQLEINSKLVKKEGVEVGKVKRKIYLILLKAQGLFAIMFTATLIISNILRAGSNLWLSSWSNDKPNIDGTQDINQRDYRLGIYGGICAGFVVTHGLHHILLIYGSIKAARSLHLMMLQTVFKAPQWFFDITPIGRILNRFSSDISIIDMQLPNSIRMFSNFFIQFIVSLIIIVVKMPWMTIVAVLFIVIFYFIQNFNIASGRQLRRLDSTTKSPIYSLFSESINGSKTIRAYKRQNLFFENLTSKIDENTICAYLSLISQRWLIVRLELLGALMLFAVSVFAILGRESYDPGTVGLVISFTITLTTNLKFLFNAASIMETNVVSVERVMEYSRLPQEIEKSKTKQVTQKTTFNNVWLTNGAIEFKNYVTKYREELDTVLNGITCSIRGGEKVGVVGRTGAGKSSLTLALFRIIESVEGAIIIDGEDIATIDLHDLRKSLTIIPQDPVLFSGPLRMNIDPFKQSSDEALWKALELSHLKSFILTLPSKLDFQISEGGENLSVGQRQLLCLTRALLKNTKILILDEATAAVDFETDSLIQTTIRQEFADCTVITIAHRINTVMDNDRIMVLNKGIITEFDSPANLLKNTNSVFYGMAKDAGLL